MTVIIIYIYVCVCVYIYIYIYIYTYTHTHTLGSSKGTEPAHNGRDWGSIPGLGRSPGEGHDNPHQYSCLENSMDREIGWL